MTEAEPTQPAIHRYPAASAVVCYQDPRLCSALILMEQHIDDELTIDNIADSVGISRR